jgi:hypothetical protein
LPRLPPPTCARPVSGVGLGPSCYPASLLWFPGPRPLPVFRSAICDCLSLNVFGLLRMPVLLQRFSQSYVSVPAGRCGLCFSRFGIFACLSLIVWLYDTRSVRGYSISLFHAPSLSFFGTCLEVILIQTGTLEVSVPSSSRTWAWAHGARLQPVYVRQWTKFMRASDPRLLSSSLSVSLSAAGSTGCPQVGCPLKSHSQCEPSPHAAAHSCT